MELLTLLTSVLEIPLRIVSLSSHPHPHSPDFLIPLLDTLLIDTGSSNTWLGANKTYVKTDTSQDTGNTVAVSYGSGNFTGEEYTDTVTLGSGLTITGQSYVVYIHSTHPRF